MTIDRIGKEIIKSMKLRIEHSEAQILSAESKTEELKEDIEMLKRHIIKIGE